MEWPERPSCHDDDPHALGLRHRSEWRPPELHREPTAAPFRSCSYCGSIHPEDLFEALRAGVTLEGSDWKYGWPHKFYVKGIPNPLVGKQVRTGGISLGIGDSDKTQDQVELENPRFTNWHKNPRGHWEADRISDAPAHSFAKWYNIHLKDLEPQAFSLLAGEIQRLTRITFNLVDGELHYQTVGPRGSHE